MHIYPVSSFYNKNSIPVFKSTFRETYDKNGKVVNRNTTEFSRSDLEFGLLPELFEKTFPGNEPVKFYDYGCSIGEEPYTFTITLLSQLGNKADKYFPIIARDIDIDNIKHAVNADIDAAEISFFFANYSEMMQLKDATNSRFRDYMYVTALPNSRWRLLPKPILREKVEFKIGGINKDVDNIENSRVIVSCRNFWPYLSEKEQNDLMRKLSEKFTDNQHLLLLGGFDLNHYAQNNIAGLPEKYGFIQTEIPNVYKKRKLA